MIDYIYLGPTPAFEPCVQIIDPDYSVKAYAECQRYKRLLEYIYAEAHGGQTCPARIVIKSEPHDFGWYYEVAVKYDTADEAESLAAYWLDENAPDKWPEQNLCQQPGRLCDDSCIGPGPMFERC